MRVLHLTRDFPPRSAGGTSTAVGSLVEALRQGSVACEVVSFDHWRGRAGAREVLQSDTGEGAAVRVSAGWPFAAVEAAASSFRPTLIHLHHENLWPFAERLREGLGTPVLYTVHTLQPRRLDEPPATHSATDQRTALDRADLVTVPSCFAARAVASENATNGPEIAPNIIDIPADAPRSAQHPSGPEAPLATYVGRFDHAKGTDLLFDIMKIALREDPELRFEIAGGLPASGKRERRWLRRWESTATADQLDRVRFRGWLASAELEELYARSSVHVVPSRCETFGLSAAEAMARGVAVVASRCEALAELIDDGETGVLCDDPTGMAAQVVRLARNRESSRELGRRAACSIQQNYGTAAVLPTWLQLYERAQAIDRVRQARL